MIHQCKALEWTNRKAQTCSETQVTAADELDQEEAPEQQRFALSESVEGVRLSSAGKRYGT